LKTVLTIAGSDSSGGAGIQADIKTIESCGVFATSVITALTAQNTLGVNAVFDIPSDFIKEQIKAVFEDIVPDAIKIGMISNPNIAVVVSEELQHYGAKKIVCDPVMVSTSGASLSSDSAIAAVASNLFPLSDVITPNIHEAEVLSDIKISSLEDMERAALVIQERIKDKYWGDAGIKRKDLPHIYLKGGHMPAQDDQAVDFLLCPSGEGMWVSGPYVQNENTHGSGCTLSSAIASGMAGGLDVVLACRGAKSYITGALEAKLDLGHGCGPLNHMWVHR
jgi:hydroxymethylpyrimidine/phosphomethylpyrimidine kinase